MTAAKKDPLLTGPEAVERNPDATAHYEDGVIAALQRVREVMPSRYRALVNDVAREMGITL